MLKLLPQILIFLSLGIIIFLVVKSAPRLREFQKRRQLKRTSLPADKQFAFGVKVKNFFIYALDSFLSLIRGLVSKLQERLTGRKNSGKLDSVDFDARDDVFERGENARTSVDINREKMKEDFFSSDISKEDDYGHPVQVAGKKESFFGNLLKKKDSMLSGFGRHKTGHNEKSGYETEFGNDDDFSDGVVSVERNPEAMPIEEGALMKEVVEVRRKSHAEELDADEELGIDRQILEKKIIQKIARDPKNIENYRQLGELYIKMKNYSDALESYKQILRIVPRDVDAKRKIEKIKLLKRIEG